MNIVNVHIPEYIFDMTSNPYFFDEDKPKSLKPIANTIENTIKANFDINNILIRGIQSNFHTLLSREQLIDKIIENGNDIYNNARGSNILHATLFKGGITTSILEAFHRYKPKGQELPQYPVDIWMIFDQNVYNNIEYVHPRHNIIVNDRWKQRKECYGLLGLVIVN